MAGHPARIRRLPLLLFAAAVFFRFPAAGAPFAAEIGTVEEVVDGDTLRVSLGERQETIRLIGIDAPERNHPLLGKEYLGDESAAYLSSLCRGKTVRLEKEPGGEETDRYDRLLRYVHLPPPDGRMLNLEMLRAGMARAYTRFPFSRRDEFLGAEAAARKEGIGLWKDGGTAEARWLASGKGRRVEVFPAGGGEYVVSHGGWLHPGTKRWELAKEIEWVLKARAELSDAEFARRARDRGYRPVDPAADTAPLPDAPDVHENDGAGIVSWKEAGRHVGEPIVVEGTIVRTHRTETMLYLNFHTNWKRYLTLVIPGKDLSSFPENPETFFRGKKVRARGKVIRYKERLEMVLRDPADITVIP